MFTWVEILDLEYFEIYLRPLIRSIRLSSFQLIDLHKSPHISGPDDHSDHLDYHKDEASMSVQKRQFKIPRSNDYSIYNIDYLNSVKIGQQGMGKDCL